MNGISLILLFSSLFSISFGKTITITWSQPENINKPANGPETLNAISTHLQALHLSNVIPRLLKIDKKLQIKLCPPQPYDPLVKEFTVPRLAGYSALYDHECIKKYDEVEVKWGSKPPKKPEQPVPKAPENFGLSIPSFILQVIKYNQRPKTGESNEVWLINSDSLRSWFTAPILNHLSKSKLKTLPIYAEFMQQINVMYGDLGEKDLKNMPQAIQGALLVLLPDYSAWSPKGTLKKLFNPTWWQSRMVPLSKSEIIKLTRKAVDNERKSDQLVIVHHEPSTFNFEIIKELSAIYGEKNLISSTRVLPKTASTLQLLQFIQKAARLVVDSRDALGRLSLLAVGHSRRVKKIQDFLPYTVMEIFTISLLTAWFIGVVAVGIYYTQKNYSAPLHKHLERFALFSMFAIIPIYILYPSLWPDQVSMSIFNIIEAGYEKILYGIVGLYATAGLITSALILVKKWKRREEALFSSEEVDLSDTESIQLIPK